ncbi:hypothetical protein [uncultured Acinetobacter sp.]|uniref:hypothetical protein n=1 Tax=uncultured Acinetobacter sp. TaxID=165433 RepID=UPI0026184F92|nr:hypothetical protein [uncultured Acinetobacter sp.]
MQESDQRGIREIVDTLFHNKAEPDNRTVLPDGYDDLQDQLQPNGKVSITPPTETESYSLYDSGVKEYSLDKQIDGKRLF